jgi:hypothetical protein
MMLFEHLNRLASEASHARPGPRAESSHKAFCQWFNVGLAVSKRRQLDYGST